MVKNMKKQKLYKSLAVVGIMLFSYIAVLFVLTSEGLQSSSTMIKHDEVDLSRTIPIQDADFSEIQINKNLLYTD